MTGYARLHAGGRVHEISGQTLTPFLDEDALRQWRGIGLPYAAVMSEALLANRLIAPVKIAFGDLVRTSGDPRVFMVADETTLKYVPSLGLAEDLGFRSVVKIVEAPDLAGYDASTSLSSFVTCSGKTYVAASGKLYAVSTASGFMVSALPPGTCGRLAVSSDAPRAVLVQVAGRPEVWSLDSGLARHVTTWEKLVQLDGAAPRVLTVTAGALSQIPQAP